jgi:tRNA-2-methylthio-N6-dimethylallyladenosine synthase
VPIINNIKTVSDEEIEKQYEYMHKVKEAALARYNKPPKYFINTMGCKLNEADSEKLAGMLEEMGYVKSEQYDDANLVLFNTCSIRENAEEKVFGKLR